MPSLIGESVTLVVNFSNFADTLNNVDLVTQTFTVGAGVELTNVPVSYTFTSGGYPQTLTGSISVDVTASGYTVSFSGTQQGGQLSFILSSVADESAGAVTAATETASSGIMAGVNQTLAPSFSTANGGSVTAGFFPYGYQPGVSLSQTVAFTLADPTVPPAVTTNTGATVLEGGLLTIANTQLQTTDSDTVTTSLTYRVTSVATNGILFRDLDGDNVVDAGETRGLNNTFTQADIDAGRIKYLHNGGETTSASFGFSVTDGHDTVTGNTFSLSITPVNDAPTGSGLPTDVTVTEDLAGNLDLSGVTLADVDSTNLTLTLTASAGTMAASDGGGVTVAGSGTGTLTLSGTAADLQTYLDTVSNVQYTGAANASGNDAATVSVSVGDGTDTTPLGSVNIDITAVNDAPTGSGLPTDVMVTEDLAGNLDLSGVTLADVDSTNLTLTLTASAGTMAASDGGGVTVAGSGTGTLTLSGTAADLQTYLDTVSNVQYTGAANASGSNAASVSVSVGDGTDTTPLGSVSIDITAVNDAPTGSGLPTDVMVTEDVAGNLDLSGVTLADVDSTNLTLTLTASAGTMAASDGGGVTVAGSGTGTLTLSGTVADLQTYLDTVSNVQYTGAANASGNDAATVSVSVGDGTDTTPLGSVNIDITAVNDAPEVTAPASIAVTEDVSTALTGISFADVDAGGSSVTATLSVPLGSLTASSGSGVTVGGTASALTLTGTIADINAFIAASGVSFTTAANATDAVTLTASIDDGGNSGTGGAQTDSTTVTLDVTAVNDAPTGSGLPSDLTVTEDTAGNLDLSGLTVADLDSAGNLTLTLTASAGTMTASDGGGVTVSGSGSGTLTLTGLAADLNSYLTDAASIQYTGALNANGDNAASVAVSVGDGTDTTPLGNVNIDITAVNDAPTGSGLPTDVTVTEDVASNLDLSALSVADVDSAGNLTLTLTASEGTMTASNGTTTTIIMVPGPGYFDPVLMIWMPGPPMPMPSITTTVTVSGSGTGTLTLTGTAADLNAYLADATKIQYTGALNANGNDAATLSVSVGDGTDTTPLGTVNIDITAVPDTPLAQDDAFTLVDTGTLVATDLFADNGNGVDVDVDTAPAITAVNGVAGDVGTQITLASGALLTVRADGTFDYDTNGAFEHLPLGSQTGDSFTYELNGGPTATVTLTINGVDNRDLLTGTGGDDNLQGGLMADTLVGGAGNDTMDGGAANDLVDYSAATQRVVVDLSLSGVAQRISASEGIDTLTDIENVRGGAGGDRLVGNATHNVLTGNAGDDNLFGLSGIDTLYGGDGNDGLYGGDGNDQIFGMNDNDRLFGGEGNDTMDGGAGIDFVDYGSATGTGVNVNLSITGMQFVSATEGADTLVNIENVNGSALGDTLTGNSADNVLYGNAGNDLLSGGDGIDRLVGGLGQDTLTGGAGEDVFFFTRVADSNLTSGRDTITDFVSGTDKINLEQIDAISGLAGNQEFTFLGTGAFTGEAGQLRVAVFGANSFLLGDIDGNGAADLNIGLLGVTSILASDIIL
ncbi:hypothetical protein D2N39_01385 [Gemmobacter lutimaris]|uniref:Tandem-95 repeat protein n=1 Tax=Gemmobacter lutimaris TaxID=2306023 RepID=A0A398BYT8_9RHOB|nr:cadherin-like domain-containing protein [Gemmobacter lutimaris]RID93598.1 hypothetical protein D2N39_01385 [Gemmobacter lutimaris]